MIWLLAAPFAGTLLAPWIVRRAGRRSGWIAGLLPALLFAAFSTSASRVSQEGSLLFEYAWAPSLGLSLNLLLDGLSLLFVLIISGIGTLVVVYSGGYFRDDPRLGRLYQYLFLFMGSMLGMVLAENLLALFVFWELTSISSFLLIGFNTEKEESRKAALQALLITAGGGLALLAGVILLGQIGGTYDLTLLFQQGDAVRSNELYRLAFLLILAGCFTKSAQFPFHFWLPGAMQAPTPVSAYLHSATMVKAGIYLLARLNPVLGGTDEWYYLLTGFGAVTMLAGGYMALAQDDLKRLLAFSTVSALGALVLLLGIDTMLSVKAALVFLLVHSLYKGALFMVAGSVDHACGSRRLSEVQGIFRSMPWTGTAAVLAALSMAGVLPFFGFIGKELLYEAKLNAPQIAGWVTGFGVASNVAMFAAAAILVWDLFFLSPQKSPRSPHEAPRSMLLGPLLLASLGLVLGLLPDLAAGVLIAPAVTAVVAEPTVIKLKLWHGLSPVLLLSVATVAAGTVLFALRSAVRRLGRGLAFLSRWGPGRAYQASLEGLLKLAQLQTSLLQNGFLRIYLIFIVSAATALILSALVFSGGFPAWPSLSEVSNLQPLDLVIGLLIILAALSAVRSRSRLAAIASLGAVGGLIALLFVLYSAPDVAMTQILIETLTVILFVFVFYRLPGFKRLSGTVSRMRDALVAGGVGLTMTLLVLAAVQTPHDKHTTEFYAAASKAQAYGENVVNVILVDFRVLDTLGEVTVLVLAALGVWSLLKLRPKSALEDES